MKATKRMPYAYSGEGSAVSDYFREEKQTSIKPKRQENWALFDNTNTQHRTILAQMRTAQWVIPNGKHGEVADLERLSNWLKSELSPVKKPLKQMEPWELSKIIEALKGIVKSKYK